MNPNQMYSENIEKNPIQVWDLGMNIQGISTQRFFFVTDGRKDKFIWEFLFKIYEGFVL